MLQFTKFNRLIVAGIAAAAITPTAALASPATDVGGTAPQTQDNRAPDQVAPGSKAVKPEVGPPTWPVNPQPIVNAAPSGTSTDDGIDDGVLIAIGGGALLLVGGIGLAGRRRLRVVRQRQLA